MGATNSEIIKTVVDNMPEEQAQHLKDVKNGADVLAIFESYPTVANSFIKTLTNKVTKSLVYSKIFTNPLKSLKKGTLDYGDSIEELFVQMAQLRGFAGHWDSGNTEEADLIRKLVPKVSAMYIKTNVDYKGKATIMDKQLRKAFINEGGLSNLVGQIVGSITSSMEFNEFKYTKTVVNELVGNAQAIAYINDDDAEPVLTTINQGASNPIKQTPYVVNTNGNPLTLSQELRETVGLMQFPSTKFNLAKELTWSEPNRLVLITTPTVNAKLDTQVLANAFNVSSAELITKTIIVDELPSGIFKGSDDLVDKVPGVISGGSISKDESKKPIAVLVDEDLIQIWDTHQGAGTFHNPEGEYTNHFGNRSGIFATCLFANMAVFY